MKEFIEQTLHFLEDGGVHFHNIEIRSVINSGDNDVIDGGVSIPPNVFLKKHERITLIIMFTLFDALVGEKYGLEGTNNDDKYKALPTEDNDEIIFKEVFRILKVVRDAAIHEPSNLKFRKGGFKLSYTHRKTPYSISCSNLGLSYLASLIKHYALTLGDSDAYLSAYSAQCYQKLCQEINKFKDDFDSELSPLKNPMPFNISLRFRMKAPQYEYLSAKQAYQFKRYDAATYKNQNIAWRTNFLIS